MLKISLSLVAISLVGLGNIDTAKAGRFSECTAALGKKGGEEARMCVFYSTPMDNPNFFNSFIKNHCEKDIDPVNKVSCKNAHSWMKEKERLEKEKLEKEAKKDKE